MASFSNYTKDGIVNLLFNGAAFTPPTTLHLSLHSALPSGTGSNEITGGAYARQTFTATNSTGGAGAAENEAAITYTGMPAVNVSHVGVWDAATGGNFIMFGTLRDSGGNPVTRSFQDGDTFTIAAGDLDLTVS